MTTAEFVRRGRTPPSTATRLAVGIVLAGVIAALALVPLGGAPWPTAAGARLLGEFLGAALRPAWWSEDPTFRELVGPLPWAAAMAAARTVAFATSAMVLALGIAAPLGVLASESFWSIAARRAGFGRTIRRVVRVSLVGARSLHELMWAGLLLAAIGLSATSAVVAIAIPYAGILGKLFAEMLDEAPRDASDALGAVGATPLAAFVVGAVPRAIPDLASYAFYRFECALRSSAVLGFFGFPTLGLALKQSFENLHFREVWTYLWTLFALIALVEAWSWVLRRRLGR